MVVSTIWVASGVYMDLDQEGWGSYTVPRSLCILKMPDIWAGMLRTGLQNTGSTAPRKFYLKSGLAWKSECKNRSVRKYEKESRKLSYTCSDHDYWTELATYYSTGNEIPLKELISLTDFPRMLPRWNVSLHALKCCIEIVLSQ